MLTDAQWAALEPLVEACRPKGKTPPQDLRRTMSAILWRHQNGAKWRAVPADLGPWSRVAQTFIRWARLGVWERLLTLAQQRGGVQLGMTFLDGTSVRAHHKAAGAARKGALRASETHVKRLAALVAGTAPRPSSSPTGMGAPWPSGSGRGRHTSCPTPCRC
jgi:transposase